MYVRMCAVPEDQIWHYMMFSILIALIQLDVQAISDLSYCSYSCHCMIIILIQYGGPYLIHFTSLGGRYNHGLEFTGPILDILEIESSSILICLPELV